MLRHFDAAVIPVFALFCREIIEYLSCEFDELSACEVAVCFLLSERTARPVRHDI
jgi:hypothetical protein